MTIEVQNILVYALFALAIGYFVYRFYAKKIKKKPVNVTEKRGCDSGNCGCS